MGFVCLGEILIDFTPTGLSEQGNILFERNPGGAPANVAVCISRLGEEAAFIGKVGEDIFGHFLRETLEENKVETSGLVFDKKEKTTLAFVQLNEKNDRSFSFYRDPGADTSLKSEEINYSLIDEAKIFHFGSLSLTHEPARTATIEALKYAKDKGCLISYDPNLRTMLWDDLKEAKEQIISVLYMVDILKISDEELAFITGITDLDEGTKVLFDKYKIPIIHVTLGKKGSYCRKDNFTEKYPPFENYEVVDTTGAGDCFLGGFIYYLMSLGIYNVNEITTDILNKAIPFANASAGFSVKGKGAIPSMPYLEQVNAMINLD